MENGPFINDLLFQMVLFLVFRRKLLDWQRARLHPSPLGVSDRKYFGNNMMSGLPGWEREAESVVRGPSPAKLNEGISSSAA